MLTIPWDLTQASALRAVVEAELGPLRGGVADGGAPVVTLRYGHVTAVVSARALSTAGRSGVGLEVTHNESGAILVDTGPAPVARLAFIVVTALRFYAEVPGALERTIRVCPECDHEVTHEDAADRIAGLTAQVERLTAERDEAARIAAALARDVGRLTADLGGALARTHEAEAVIEKVQEAMPSDEDPIGTQELAWEQVRRILDPTDTGSDR